MNTPFVPADLRPLTPEQFKASVARQYDEKFAKFGLTWATRDARIAAMSAPVVPVIPVAPAPRPRTVGSWSTGYDYLNTK